MLSKAAQTFGVTPFAQKTQFLLKSQQRFSSISLATSAGNYNTPFLTSNKFVLVHYPVVGNP